MSSEDYSYKTDSAEIYSILSLWIYAARECEGLPRRQDILKAKFNTEDDTAVDWLRLSHMKSERTRDSLRILGAANRKLWFQLGWYGGKGPLRDLGAFGIARLQDISKILVDARHGKRGKGDRLAMLPYFSDLPGFKEGVYCNVIKVERHRLVGFLSENSGPVRWFFLEL